MSLSSSPRMHYTILFGDRINAGSKPHRKREKNIDWIELDLNDYDWIELDRTCVHIIKCNVFDWNKLIKIGLDWTEGQKSKWKWKGFNVIIDYIWEKKKGFNIKLTKKIKQSCFGHIKSNFKLLTMIELLN